MIKLLLFKINLRYSISLLILILYSFASFSQTAVCEGNPCTSNDFVIVEWYLGDENGDPIASGDCVPGELIEVHLWVTYAGVTAADRYSLYIHFNLWIEGVFITTIDECFYDQELIPPNTPLDIHVFDWPCGADLLLTDLYMSYQTSISNNCGCQPAHCQNDIPSTVSQPLIANFEFSHDCPTEFTIDFTSLTTGGTLPYIYNWDFGMEILVQK